MKLSQEAIVEAFSDQQHRVGSMQPGFQQLIRVEKKILTKQRKFDAGSDTAQIRKLALKKRLVRQHADARCAVSGINSGNPNRIEFLADQTLGRTGLFH